jgi:phosphoglycerate kinase
MLREIGVALSEVVQPIPIIQGRLETIAAKYTTQPVRLVVLPTVLLIQIGDAAYQIDGSTHSSLQLDAAGRIDQIADLAEAGAITPTDAVAAKDFKAHAPSRVVSVDEVADDEMILDMGPRSTDAVVAILKTCRTLVWNGPFGAFELQPFDAGTNAVAKAAADLTRAGALVTVAGGGDTVSALNQSGAADSFTYISTAGGAFLEWLEGKVLPGVEALRVK